MSHIPRKQLTDAQRATGELIAADPAACEALNNLAAFIRSVKRRLHEARS